MPDEGKEEKGHCEQTDQSKVQLGRREDLILNQVQSFNYYVKLDTVNDSTKAAFFFFFFYFKGPKCFGTIQVFIQGREGIFPN